MATETKKDRKKSKSKDGNFLTSMMDGTRTYIGEVRSELKKVSWPERPDVIRLTRIVLIVTIISGLVLGLMSFGFSQLIKFGIVGGTNNWIIFVVIFIALIGGAIYMFQRENQKTGY
ncbi:MAG: preprotein translocase subunit SecE [Anaerolineae bacterium]|nr:preprotein translocase subunit SecE [Anaerolineae bacterium]